MSSLDPKGISAEQERTTPSRMKALRDILTYIETHRMVDTHRTGWTFNRDELYAERLGAYGTRSVDGKASAGR